MVSRGYDTACSLRCEDGKYSIATLLLSLAPTPVTRNHNKELWRVCTVRLGAVRFVFPPLNVGGIPMRSRTYLSVLLHWGTKRSERVPTSLSYTHRPLIGRQNRHFRATGIKTNTVPANRESFVYYGAFPPQGSVQSTKVRYGSRFHCQKVGVTRTEPHCAILLSEYSSVWVLRP